MHNAPNISPNHKQVTREQVAALPKVVLHDHLDTTGARGEGDIEAAARAAVDTLAAEGVIYAELRFAPELNLDVVDLDTAIAAAERGVRSAADTDTALDARLILLAMRHQEHVAAVADATIAALEREVVVGFDLAGPEQSLVEHRAVLDKLRDNYVPVTLHAGAHEGVDVIDEAMRLGAQRIGHGARIFEDFNVDVEGITLGPIAAWARDRSITLELAPTLEVNMGVVDEYADHPLTLLQQLGFTCTLNPGQSAVTSLTDEMMRLVETFDYGYDEFFDLTRTALENAFIPVPRRTQLLAQRIVPAYEELTGLFNEDAAFAEAHEHHGEDGVTAES